MIRFAAALIGAVLLPHLAQAETYLMVGRGDGTEYPAGRFEKPADCWEMILRIKNPALDLHCVGHTTWAVETPEDRVVRALDDLRSAIEAWKAARPFIIPPEWTLPR